MNKTEHDHREHDARFVLWQEIQDGEAHVLPGGQLEKELELEFGAFARDPETDDLEMEDGLAGPGLDDEPSLVPGVTLGELRRRSEERTAFSVLSAFFSLPLARKKRPLPRLVTRTRAAGLFEQFFGPRAYLAGRIYS